MAVHPMRRKGDKQILAIIIASLAVFGALIFLGLRHYQGVQDTARDQVVREACEDRRRLQQEHNDLVIAVERAFKIAAADRERIARVASSPGARRVALSTAQEWRGLIGDVATVKLSRCR